jgi:dihydroflavonol-4-reductase
MTSSNRGRAVVLGANGFLGSHVVRALVASGREVRAMVRKGSDCRSLAGVSVPMLHGDVLDPPSLARAVEGCSTVFHCVVDTRAWLRDADFHRVNVEGLRNAMDAALAAGVERFVFTSTIGTIGRSPSGVATERDAFDWAAETGAYIRSRAEAEALFFEYCWTKGLPGVALNVANTFGVRDYAPTPHGKLLDDAARGRLPITWDARFSCVGVEDAADAMLLAESRGRVGERYIVSERTLPLAELFRLGAEARGKAPFFVPLPRAALYAVGALADAAARVLGTSFRLSVESVRLTHVMSDMDATKAREELGWSLRPIAESIRDAVRFYDAERRRARGDDGSDPRNQDPITR